MATLRAVRLPVLALLLVAVLPAASAAAARRSAARPSITSIGPRSVAIGDTLTIRGRGFLAGARRNTVSFKRAGSPTVSVKAGAATRTRLKVVVPAALSRYLSAAQSTRFRVRVRARRLSKSSTALARSVLVRPREDAGGAADGCEPTDLNESLTDPLDDALGTDLGDALDGVLPDAGCASEGDAATAGDDPGAGDDGADPGDGDPADSDPAGSDPLDPLAAGDFGDPISG